MPNIYVYPPLTEQSDIDSLVSRMGWYFKPYLDVIGKIYLGCSRPGAIAATTLAPMMDPLLREYLPAVKAKIEVVTPGERLEQLINAADVSSDIFLLWDESAEKTASAPIAKAMKAFAAKSGLYRVDRNRTRMEGSFYLLAGLNKFADQAGSLTQNHQRLKAMVAEIGFHDKAYVFGSGPSLSDFVDGHDFSDGLCIISNSIVKNRDIIAKTRPKVITAGDPLYHAGCSSYAGAFRSELVSALRETGAWFVCPMRDFAIYDAFLPRDLRPRIVGIPYVKEAPPPIDLGKAFYLRPYPNVLTLALLPLAATFAKRIEIVGCDGRRLTDDSFFWSHDKKAQFNDKMADIEAAHPAFFAINYNDYYTGHCRDVEEVLTTLEQSGKVVVTSTPSMIPALHAREASTRAAAVRPKAVETAETLVMLDPDAMGDWGHFLAYDKRLAEAASGLGLKVAVLCREDLNSKFKPDRVDRMIPTFSVHSWTIGNQKPGPKHESLMKFAQELDDGLAAVEDSYPTGKVCIFFYVGSAEAAEVLEHLLVYRPRFTAVVNLFWSYNFDQNGPAYRKRWEHELRRIHGSDRVRLTHSTAKIASEYRADWNLDIPVLPHPSTTFSDAKATALAQKTAVSGRSPDRFRVVFPGGSRKEKGFVLAIAASTALARNPSVRPVLRARIDSASGPDLAAAFKAADFSGIEVVDGDISDDEFVEMIADGDIIVIPYSSEAFRRRTSGILIDAVLLGKPVVVLKETWLADLVLAENLGGCADPSTASVVAAVESVIKNYGSFAAPITAAAKTYLAENSWVILVSKVLRIAGASPPGDVSSTRLELAQLAENYKALSTYAAEIETRLTGTRLVPKALPPGASFVDRLAQAKDPASARLLLLTLGSAYLLRQDQITARVAADKALQDSVAQALATLKEDDALRLHFLKTQRHYSQSGGTN